MGRPRNFDDEDVIERAMDTFWTHGYAGSSPAQLAAATGIGKGSLYNAFKSKRDLFAEALACYDRRGTAFISDFLAQPGTTAQRLGAYLRFLVDADLDRDQPRGCLATNTAIELAGHDHEITSKVRVIMDRSISLMAGRIAQGQRDGDVDAGVNPQACAEFLMNTLSGLRVMAKTHDRPILHRIIDSALAVL